MFAGHTAMGTGEAQNFKKNSLPEWRGRASLPPRPQGGRRSFYFQPPFDPMAYAVFKTGGKQYRVQQGDQIDVEKLDLEVGNEATFDEVLLVRTEDTVKIGDPVVEGAKVTAKVLDQFRSKKGIAFKFKRRKGYHKTKGFRRSLTKLEITEISG
jgi:large subunit ribosomal protein L21